MYHNRLEVIDYLYPHWTDHYTFMTTLPARYLDFDYSIILKPFLWQVWICLIITFIILLLFDWLEHNVLYERKRSTENAGANRTKRNENGNFLWITLAILLNQPNRQIRKNFSLPKKICLITWILMAIIIMNGYGAGLKSIMTVPSRGIDTVEKLNAACRNNPKMDVILYGSKNIRIFLEVSVFQQFIYLKVIYRNLLLFLFFQCPNPNPNL